MLKNTYYLYFNESKLSIKWPLILGVILNENEIRNLLFSSQTIDSIMSDLIIFRYIHC